MSTTTTSYFKIKKRTGDRVLIDADQKVLEILEHRDRDNNRYVHPIKKQELLDASKESNLSKAYTTPEDLFSDLFGT